ncbi:PqqD family protein [Euzebya tangerina]|uniref:PqqD family protein n=1 Tax=Euzebya tangerina TaxID=591198 RepID=UPI0013C2FFB7|nr:PqqD family protein [Euzebya tangerina]
MQLQLDDQRVSWREIDGEVIAVDLTRDEYLSLNHTGSLLWRELVAGATITDLVDRLVQAFAVDARTASRDVTEFVTTLRERRLLTDAAESRATRE